MRSAWALLLVLLVSVSPARADDAPAVRMSEPRPFGYFVGDEIVRLAEIEAAPGETFEGASLPNPGPLAYWLELRAVEPGSIKHSGQQWLTLRLAYQLFYVPLDTRRLKIPAANIELKGGAGGKRLVTLPPFEFLVSPIRETFPEKSGETTETFLKADAQAQRLPSGPVKTRALLAAIASALALTLLAFHRAWWPFHQRPGRPFTEAARTVADHRQGYSAALLALHRAFDRAQGERLLASDIDSFFVRQPGQATVRDEVRRFFSASQTLFFSGDQAAAEAALPRAAIERLALDLAANERVAA